MNKIYTYDFNFISSAGRATFSIKSPKNDEPLKEIVYALIEPFIISDPQDASQKAIEIIKRYECMTKSGRADKSREFTSFYYF